MEDARITDISRVTPDVRQYTVELLEGEFDGIPGQHTAIRAPGNGDGSGGVKPYSTLAVDGDRLVLMIRTYEDGTVSKYMGDRETGDVIQLSTSLTGSLTLESTERPAVFISTGTGITPMIAILHQYLRTGGEHATFMFGEKTTDQLMYKSMLEQMSATYDLDVVFATSRESWSGREGYIQESAEDVFDEFGVERDYYLCGVPRMVVETKETLADLGVPPERVHSEGWEDSQVSEA
ncbi:MAG: 2-polyprenylphenol hydroxylase related flavodoxin oxidoreductase [uncultured archaeon A07HR67]|jgi:2-polyprenylphenol hydroxylase and related flavodoxin oxidoreductases|nr:MAG: 2-polyprenylphenol hydroxylase related flavodoxin oxidoreductase [uncultured archaeon A07HR67]